MLTNTEMLELVPQKIKQYYFNIEREYSGNYTASYSGRYETLYSSTKEKLRDALFEMIKYLKTNKLM